jgi:hypothetical protein
LGKNLLPEEIRATYQVEERHHACSILKTDFPEQWKDLLDVLHGFKLRKSHVAKKGGNKSPISRAIDALFFERGWVEKSFDIKVTADGNETLAPPTMSITIRTAWLSKLNGTIKIRSLIAISLYFVCFSS